MGRNAVDTLSCFRNAQEGSVAAWFAVALLPALFAVGASVDYSRAATSRTKLQQATDAAVIAAAVAAPTMTDDKVEQATLDYLKAHLKNSGVDVRIDKLTITEGRSEVLLQTSATYRPMVLREGNFKDIEIGANAKAVTANKNYEIAIVFDTSGSMSSSAGGVSKMQSAKSAAKSLVDTMFETPESAKRTKISLVPFAASVNAGSQYAGADWTDKMGLSTIHWQNLDKNGSSWLPQSRFEIFTELGIEFGGCFESRPGNWGVTDMAANSGSPDSLFVPMFAPDEPGTKGQSTYWRNSGGTGKTGNNDTKWTYSNSYMDDNDGVCTSMPASTDPQARQARVCKYKINKNLLKMNTGSGRGPNHRCDTKPIVRLSDQPATIKSAVDGLVDNGVNTNTFEGLMWGWRTLSPNSPFRDGAGYGDNKTTKILIVLTDGENAWNSQSSHNQSMYSPFAFYKDDRLANNIDSSGKARDAIDSKTRIACENAKAAGVRIYTVGFSTPGDKIDSKGLNLLKNCASSDTMAYVAQNADGLQSVFNEIARNIGTLRLAQ